MRKRSILITGAAGEIGDALIRSLASNATNQVITLDIRPLSPETAQLATHVQGDLLDQNLLARLVSEYEIATIFHLAALLSTRAEFTPEAAHKVNVEGTLGLLKLASEQSQWRGEPVKFIFPSSIAAYGMPDMETKVKFPHVREWEWNYPTTMYGCNKLYCELLGTYYSRNFRQLAAEKPVMVDFRSVRFPGLISAYTVPSGGTSDYGPEMLHAAAKNEPYPCFVRTRYSDSIYGDARCCQSFAWISSSSGLSAYAAVYNVTSFSLTAAEFRDQVLRLFPMHKSPLSPT